jgi:hypothetical protein
MDIEKIKEIYKKHPEKFPIKCPPPPNEEFEKELDLFLSEAQRQGLLKAYDGAGIEISDGGNRLINVTLKW